MRRINASRFCTQNRDEDFKRRAVRLSYTSEQTDSCIDGYFFLGGGFVSDLYYPIPPSFIIFIRTFVKIRCHLLIKFCQSIFE